jgi:hypothetical protein
VYVSWNKGKCLCFGRQRLIFAGVNCYCAVSLHKALLVYVNILVLIVFASVVLVNLVSRHIKAVSSPVMQ